MSKVITERESAGNNTDVLTAKQIDYAISQTVSLAQGGPYSGMVALVKHFVALAEAGNVGQAKYDAEQLIWALAEDRIVDKNQIREAFEEERRAQFLEDVKTDIGYRE